MRTMADLGTVYRRFRYVKVLSAGGGVTFFRTPSLPRETGVGLFMAMVLGLSWSVLLPVLVSKQLLLNKAFTNHHHPPLLPLLVIG